MRQQRADWAAELARQYIEATLRVPVETWDRDARQGAHDLRYDHEGRSIAVEVKLVVDADYRALEKRIAKTGYMRDSRLTRMWDLRLKHRARVDQALRDVPDLLMHLEQRGWQDRRLWDLRKSDPVTAASLERLGVTSLWSQRPTLKHPPGFYLMPEPWGSWEQGIESLPAFVSDLLAEPHMGRLRRQLADAEVDERHAFLLLGWEHMESVLLHSRETRELPVAAPKLPEPIDGLWLASLSETKRVLAWVPHRGWFEGRRRPKDLES
jgi:hypothetical protein